MSLKIKRAFAKAGIPNMQVTRNAILHNLAQTGIDTAEMSSTDLSNIIKALHFAYRKCKAVCDAEYLADMDAVWIGGEVQRLFPADALKAIEEHSEKCDDGLHKRTYTLTFSEKFCAEGDLI